MSPSPTTTQQPAVATLDDAAHTGAPDSPPPSSGVFDDQDTSTTSGEQFLQAMISAVLNSEGVRSAIRSEFRRRLAEVDLSEIVEFDDTEDEEDTRISREAWTMVKQLSKVTYIDCEVPADPTYEVPG